MLSGSILVNRRTIMFKQLRNAILFQVHPDYFQSNPALKSQNVQSISQLLSLNPRKDTTPLLISLHSKSGKSIIQYELSPFNDLLTPLSLAKSRQKDERLEAGWTEGIKTMSKRLEVPLNHISDTSGALTQKVAERNFKTTTERFASLFDRSAERDRLVSNYSSDANVSIRNNLIFYDPSLSKSQISKAESTLDKLPSFPVSYPILISRKYNVDLKLLIIPWDFNLDIEKLNQYIQINSLRIQAQWVI